MFAWLLASSSLSYPHEKLITKFDTSSIRFRPVGQLIWTCVLAQVDQRVILSPYFISLLTSPIKTACLKVGQ